MSRVSILRQFPDGDIIKVTVNAESSFADALDEARTVATRAFADAIGITLSDTETDD